MSDGRVAGPAYRVETPRLSLRCLAPQDTAALHQAIADSVAHLRPFMPWVAHEPVSFEKRLEWVRTQRGHFDLGSDYGYGVFLRDGGALVGVATLRLSMDVDERELGYWIHPRHVRQGLGLEAAGALVKIGFDVEGLAMIELRTLPENRASARIAQRLGFLGPELDPLSFATAEGEKRDTLVYHMPRVAFASSPARALSVEAFDALERRIA